MAATVSPSDDPRALAALIRNMQARIARLETQTRLKDATLDAPGALQFKDESGATRFRVGADDMGGVGYSGYDASGALRLRLGQNLSGRVVYEGFEPDGTVRFRLGEADNGAVGYQAFDGAGVALAAAEQAQGNSPQTVTSTTYADAGTALTATATAGPSGQLMVVLSAVIAANDPTITSSGFMSFASTGGRVTAAQDINSLQVSTVHPGFATEAAGAVPDHNHGQNGTTTGLQSAGTPDHVHPITPESITGGTPAHSHNVSITAGPVALRQQRASRVVLLPGCDPTVPVVVTAKYRVSNASGSYVFDDRSLLVIPL